MKNRPPISLRALLSLCLAAALQFAFPLEARSNQTPNQASANQASANQASASAPVRKVDEMVAMRDGVKLATSIFLPEGKGPWPVVLVRTPYGKDAQAAALQRGPDEGSPSWFRIVAGRFKSEGEYRPFCRRPQDGYDTVEWVGQAAMVERQSRDVRRVGNGHHREPGRDDEAAAPGGQLRHGRAVEHLSSVGFHGRRLPQRAERDMAEGQNAIDALNETFKHNVYDGFYDSNEMSMHWQKIQIAGL